VRFIDFNQGMDAQRATQEKMAKLATIAIRPFRIAFDSWAERKPYVRAVHSKRQFYPLPKNHEWVVNS
jgi:hypothetical protein